jgi:hypothetical protein
MTPFERAEKNIKKLAENLSYTQLIQATIEETSHLSETDSDLIWQTVLTMLMVTDRMGDEN